MGLRGLEPLTSALSEPATHFPHLDICSNPWRDLRVRWPGVARKSHETQCPIARGLHDLAIRYLRAGRSLIGMAFAMEDVHKWQGVSTEAQ